MLTVAILGLFWRRRRLALTLFIGCLLIEYLWLARTQRVESDPGLRASTQEDGGICHPDFRGDWKLDLGKSDSVAPLLRTAGQSEWKIVLASKIAATHVIRGDLHRLTLLVQTPVRNQEQELLLDGTPTRATTPDGGQTLASTRWSEDGQSLITTTQASSRQPISFRITRSLADDRRTMFLDLECQGKDGKPIRVRRVFRLVSLPTA